LLTLKGPIQPVFNQWEGGGKDTYLPLNGRERRKKKEGSLFLIFSFRIAGKKGKLKGTFSSFGHKRKGERRKKTAYFILLSPPPSNRKGGKGLYLLIIILWSAMKSVQQERRGRCLFYPIFLGVQRGVVES